MSLLSQSLHPPLSHQRIDHRLNHRLILIVELLDGGEQIEQFPVRHFCGGDRLTVTIHKKVGGGAEYVGEFTDDVR